MKKRSIKVCLAAILVVLIQSLPAQEKVAVNGYVSNMGQLAFGKDQASVADYTMHNRLNMAYYANANFTFHVQLRNQLKWGESVSLTPGYADDFSRDQGWMDLNFNWWSTENFLMNTQIDRAYVEYVKGQLELSLGRQRVNWGRSLVWNPNDIFNTFSYYDFDYAERPGSDAFRAKYYLGTAASAEWVTKVDSAGKLTLAALGKWNHWSYDFQVMAGYVAEQDFVLGGGWEGQLGPVGFRGEWSYYHPKENFTDSLGVLLADLSFDYLISDKLSAQMEFLYNDKKAVLNIAELSALYAPPGSSKNLSFSQYNIYGGLLYQLSPIVGANFAGMYYTDHQGFFLMPSLEVSVNENLYLSFLYQYFNFNISGSRLGFHGAFIRLKWSF